MLFIAGAVTGYSVVSKILVMRQVEAILRSVGFTVQSGYLVYRVSQSA